MATYNKNEMLPQREEALERWGNLITELVCDKTDKCYTNASIVQKENRNTTYY